MALAFVMQETILLSKTTAAQNEDVLNYLRVRAARAIFFGNCFAATLLI